MSITKYFLTSELIFFMTDLWFVAAFLLFFIFGIALSLKSLSYSYFLRLFRFILGLWLVISLSAFMYLLLCLELTSVDFISTGSFLAGSLSYTIFNVFIKLLVLFFALVFVPDYRGRLNTFELYTLYALAILGLVVLVLSSNFLVFYLGLELQSLAIYLLIAYRRYSSLAIEASLKYYILGALSSGIFLLGVSFIYGYCGTINFQDLALLFDPMQPLFLSQLEFNNLLILASVLIVTSFIFKFSAAPLHFWAPDVYQASSFDIIGLISVISKLALFSVLVRLTLMFFFVYQFYLSFFFVVVGILSIIIGNFVGLMQTDLKRLLAYSTISHMGFLVLGFSTITLGGLVSSVFYIFIYTLTNTALLVLLRYICTLSGSSIVEIGDLAGLRKFSPIFAYMLAILLLSLAGLPPLGGFFAKYYVILQVADVWGWFITYIIIFISIIGSFFYLYIVYLLLFASSFPKFEVFSHVSSYIRPRSGELLNRNVQVIWLYVDALDSLPKSTFFICSFLSLNAIFVVFFIPDIFYLISWLLFGLGLDF